MNQPPRFISVDWGTTNFRLRVVETATLEVLHEDPAGEGVRELSRRFGGGTSAGDRLNFFGQYLQGKITLLDEAYRAAPIVVSGMASSSIGMVELPYAGLPFDGRATGLHWEKVTPWADREVLLVSGVSNGDAMMRGEETQACGLSEELAPYQRALLLLPGTHCKHLTWEDCAYTALESFMTGELFEVIARQTILANSVEDGPLSAATREAFVEGVRLGCSGRMSPNLFSVRARQLSGRAYPPENYYYLSGLLIGEELRHVRDGYDRIVLAAAGKLSELYELALAQCFDASQLSLCGGQALERALLRGQQQILRYDTAI